MWLLALVCLLLCRQVCTTMFVPCVDWWEIRCRHTAWIHYPDVVALLRLPPGSVRCCVYEPVICQYENIAGSSLVQICQAFGVQTLKRIGENSDPCGRPIVSWWGADLQFPSCINTVLSRSAPATYQVSVRLTPYCTSRSLSSLNGLEIDCHSHCLFFPLESFVHVICKCSCIFPCALYWSETRLPPPPPHPMICGENLPLLEVSGEFPGNSAFHELPNGLLHCEDALSIQLVVGFLSFRKRSQEAVCPVFGNTAFVEAFLIDSEQFSPVLFC